MKCGSCGLDAVYYARYNGMHYCGRHFSAFVEGRFRKEARAQRIFSRGKRIAVAVSGGKDSMTVLHLLGRMCRERRGTEVVAVTVDEGIRGYRDACIDVIEDYCRAQRVELFISSYADFAGFTMDALAAVPRERTTCAYCGVFRRSLINTLARESGADVLATGLNLDDTAQSIMMNMSRGDVDRLAMMGPHDVSVDGLVPRVQPLRQIPENEVMLYAMLEGIPFVRSSCPYAEEASRNLFRETVLRIEEEMPGARFAMLRAVSKMQVSRNGGMAGKCSQCGDVTSSGTCRACTLKAEASSLLAIERSS